MAIDFYKLGRQSGATTPKGQQSGFESLVSSATKPLEDMIKASQAATAALTAAMPSGVAIEKVPEQLRGKVSKYLADNKKEYTDAAKVVASGINPNSQRYRDAIETMNSVNTKFENLSNNLENIAVSRKAALDDPNYSAMTTDEDALIYSNLANGSLYQTMSINDDGTFNYKDAEGNDKLFSDFRIEKQGFTGQQTYLGLVEDLQKNALIEGATFESLKGKYQGTIDSLFDKLGPRGSLDYAFADDAFIKKYMEENNKELNELKKNPGNLVETYKKYNMDQLEQEFIKAPKYKKPEVQMPGGELANQMKQRQAEEQFNNFMKSGSEGGQMLEPPSPKQVAVELSSILGPTRIVEHNPEGEEKGFYYIKVSDGEGGVFWQKLGSETGLRWNQVKNYLDLKNIALN